MPTPSGARKHFSYFLKASKRQQHAAKIGFTDYLVLPDNDDGRARHLNDGEAKCAYQLAETSLARLILHIKTLMQIVADAHTIKQQQALAAYLQKSQQHQSHRPMLTWHTEHTNTNDSSQNIDWRDCLPTLRYNVSRLLTHEFSFYTQQPLSAENFVTLLTDIETYARLLPENVHCLLSSFAVNFNERLHNVSIYVVCGRDVTCHVFHKASEAKEDFHYASLPNTFHQITDEVFTNQAAAFVATGSNEITSSQSVFPITVYDITYLQCIDVCLDYHEKHSYRLINTATTHPQSLPVPAYVSHIVSSNILEVTRGTIIHSKQIHQADPYFSRYNYRLDGVEPHLNLDFPHFGHRQKIYKLPTVNAQHPVQNLREQIETHRDESTAIQFSLTINQTFVNQHLAMFLSQHAWPEVNALLTKASYVNTETRQKLQQSLLHIDACHHKFLLSEYADLDTEQLNQTIVSALQRNDGPLLSALSHRFSELTNSALMLCADFLSVFSLSAYDALLQQAFRLAKNNYNEFVKKVFLDDRLSVPALMMERVGDLQTHLLNFLVIELTGVMPPILLRQVAQHAARLSQVSLVVLLKTHICADFVCLHLLAPHWALLINKISTPELTNLLLSPYLQQVPVLVTAMMKERLPDITNIHELIAATTEVKDADAWNSFANHVEKNHTSTRYLSELLQHTHLLNEHNLTQLITQVDRHCSAAQLRTLLPYADRPTKPEAVLILCRQAVTLNEAPTKPLAKAIIKLIIYQENDLRLIDDRSNCCYLICCYLYDALKIEGIHCQQPVNINNHITTLQKILDTPDSQAMALVQAMVATCKPDTLHQHFFTERTNTVTIHTKFVEAINSWYQDMLSESTTPVLIDCQPLF